MLSQNIFKLTSILFVIKFYMVNFMFGLCLAKINMQMPSQSRCLSLGFFSCMLVSLFVPYPFDYEGV